MAHTTCYAHLKVHLRRFRSFATFRPPWLLSRATRLANSLSSFLISAQLSSKLTPPLRQRLEEPSFAIPRTPQSNVLHSGCAALRTCRAARSTHHKSNSPRSLAFAEAQFLSFTARCAGSSR